VDDDFASPRRAFTFTDSPLSPRGVFGVSSLNRVQLKSRSLIFCRNNFEMTEMKTLPRTKQPQPAQAAGH